MWHDHDVEGLVRENAELRELNEQLTKRLREYEGWAPDQFLRFQEEHRKLQREFLDLDSRRAEAEQRIAALEAKLAHSQRVASGAAQLVKTLEARAEQAERERDEEHLRRTETIAMCEQVRTERDEERGRLIDLRSRLLDIGWIT